MTKTKNKLTITIYKNKYDNWEARTNEKNPVTLVGPTFTGFASRDFLEEVISEVMPGITIIEAEY